MSVVRHDVRGWGVEDPQGLAVDPGSGAVYVLDGAGPRLVVVEPGGEGTWADAAVRAVELAGLEGARGLAVDPGTGHLHVYSPAGERLVELAGTGEVVATRETGELGLRSVEGLVVAPSGDQTDAAGATSLYVADAEAGAIVELSLAEAAPVAMAAAASATLVRTVHTSEWSPPSPDPSGLAYVPHLNSLLVSDGEVNEMPIFGANLFQATLTGNLVNALSTLSFSDEPAGLAHNPENKHLYIGDDTGSRGVYTLDPGPDGLYITGDDQVRFLRTSDLAVGTPRGWPTTPPRGCCTSPTG